MNPSENDPCAETAARRRGRARVKAVAVSATAASVLATAGFAVALRRGPLLWLTLGSVIAVIAAIGWRAAAEA